MVHRRRSPRIRLHRQCDRPLDFEGRLLTERSVVVVSHRPTERLSRCLESAQGEADEIVVVDNFSEGSAASEIAHHHGARAVRLPRPVSLSAALNLGFDAAQGETIGLVSQDALVSKGWIRAAAEQVDDPTIAAVGPKLVRSGRYLEVRLDDEPRRLDDRPPRSRRIGSATIGGTEILMDLLGLGILGLETAVPPSGNWNEAGTNRARISWRAATGTAPFYAPLPEGDGDVELRINGETVRPRRVVDLMYSAGRYLTSDGRVGDIAADSPANDRFDTPEERFALSGTAVVIAKETWKRVGSFEERLSVGYWFIDWCWRARLFGLRFIFDPGVQVRVASDPTSRATSTELSSHLLERDRLISLVRNAPAGVALSELWKKRHPAEPTGVVRPVLKAVPWSLFQRTTSRPQWVLTARDVFDRWAGVDAPEPVVPGATTTTLAAMQ